MLAPPKEALRSNGTLGSMTSATAKTYRIDDFPAVVCAHVKPALPKKRAEVVLYRQLDVPKTVIGRNANVDDAACIDFERVAPEPGANSLFEFELSWAAPSICSPDPHQPKQVLFFGTACVTRRQSPETSNADSATPLKPFDSQAITRPIHPLRPYPISGLVAMNLAHHSQRQCSTI